ncbi:chromo domain-containing protein [Aspergillus clavatus NRRL 1]|uniref:Chromo domain protein n=1 Tax=Aspergillus clavatus (strain ATCC 1007 / CBS 513.65 / DSM 816 / NCTC 3887 / NRRL 1 / QM 1276 / 107) TaxID=344612 RepID=A1CT44_ASPCL|nr:chromo domain protein [Aspergillus clavatus NRRL 1]EAW06481.1 chromo domain protein [Aspergillus clavatus NRRL 1]
MPPPVEDLSDGESTGESIPYNDADHQMDAAGDEKEEDAKEEDAKEEDEKDKEKENKNENETDEGLYVVEKIMGHEFAKDGKLLLQVKWRDYEDPADQTLEPEENLLEGAKEVLEEYYSSQGGRPERPAAVRKRKSMGGAKATPDKKETPKRRRRSAVPDTAASTETPEESEVPDWVPKSKSWENDVKKVDTIIRDPKTNSLIAFLHWTNDKTSKVSIETCYEKCPRKASLFLPMHVSSTSHERGITAI